MKWALSTRWRYRKDYEARGGKAKIALDHRNDVTPARPPHHSGPAITTRLCKRLDAVNVFFLSKRHAPFGFEWMKCLVFNIPHNLP